MIRTATVVTTVILLLVAALAVITGTLGWSHAVGGALVLAVLSGLRHAARTRSPDPGWPRRATEIRTGGRHEVSDLGWTMIGADGRITDQAVARLRRLAAHRLDDAGLPPDHLGTDLRGRPRMRTFRTWLDAVDRLPAARSSQPAAPPAPAAAPEHVVFPERGDT